MKFFAGLILGATAVTLYFTQFTKHPPVAEEVMVSKFKNLSENEARHYAEARTAEEKLKAADALYEKMMLIFLADLALKMQPIHKVDPVMVDATLKEPKPESTPEVLSANDEKHEATTPQSSPSKAKPVEAISEAKILKDYKDSLHSNSIDKRTRHMFGSFEGTLRHNAGKEKGRVDSVRMTLDFTLVKKGELDGSSSIVLADPQGQEYSKAQGDGGNGSLRLHPTDQDMVFIDASPSSFLSINISTLRGYYADKGIIIGEISLRKK